jgi:predicted DNA-binding transcriptional regulator AlpA
MTCYIVDIAQLMYKNFNKNKKKHAFWAGSSVAYWLHLHQPESPIVSIDSPHRIYRNKQAAQFLGVSPATYWRLIRRGELPPPVRISRQIGGQPEHILVAFVRSRQEVQS